MVFFFLTNKLGYYYVVHDFVMSSSCVNILDFICPTFVEHLLLKINKKSTEHRATCPGIKLENQDKKRDHLPLPVSFERQKENACSWNLNKIFE